jgi:hypothetical protein
MIELIYINIAIVFLIDQSGFIEKFKIMLKKVLTKGKFSDPNYSLKPIDCSLCMTFWISLIYLLIVNLLSIESFMIICLSAWSTQFTNDIYIIIKQLWFKITDKL